MKTTLFYPDKMLRKESEIVENVDDEIISLIETMKDTMHYRNGIGLASIQIGVPKRIILVDCVSGKNDLKVLINPEISEQSEEFMNSTEGCLSVLGVGEEIKRHKEVMVRATNLEGKKIEIHGKELLSSCLQHEIDHINGKLFIDRIEGNIKRNLVKSKAKKNLKKMRLGW